jgi:hypothetical protein
MSHAVLTRYQDLGSSGLESRLASWSRTASSKNQNGRDDTPGFSSRVNQKPTVVRAVPNASATLVVSPRSRLSSYPKYNLYRRLAPKVQPSMNVATGIITAQR